MNTCSYKTIRQMIANTPPPTAAQEDLMRSLLIQGDWFLQRAFGRVRRREMEENKHLLRYYNSFPVELTRIVPCKSALHGYIPGTLQSLVVGIDKLLYPNSMFPNKRCEKAISLLASTWEWL